MVTIFPENEPEKPARLKRTYSAPKMHQRQLTIDDERARAAFEIGEENFSEGVRRCIDYYVKMHNPDTNID